MCGLCVVTCSRTHAPCLVHIEVSSYRYFCVIPFPSCFHFIVCTQVKMRVYNEIYGKHFLYTKLWPVPFSIPNNDRTFEFGVSFLLYHCDYRGLRLIKPSYGGYIYLIVIVRRTDAYGFRFLRCCVCLSLGFLS